MLRRLALAGLGLGLLSPLLAPAVSAAPAADPVSDGAVAWLATQQQPDGGFEVAGFPGFETSDAILALASQAQTSQTWDEAAALAAVEAVQTGGKDALDAIDDLVDGEVDPSSDAAGARAAKILTLVVGPLGLDPHDFDPSNDSASPVDLVARMDEHRLVDGTYDFGALFNGVLYAAAALRAIDQGAVPAHADQIVAGQRPDGSWDYTGGLAGPGDDIDTTGLAVTALALNGQAAAAVEAGTDFLLVRQGANGAWQSFGSDDPNSTSVAVMALTTVGIDVTAQPGKASPYTWLRSQQNADGRINSPNDAYGVNTLPTTQTLQVLGRLPYQVADRADLFAFWSLDLASPLTDLDDSRPLPEASDVLGNDAAITSRRVAAARSILRSAQGREAAIEDLFQTALGRSADPSGRAYWAGRLTTLARPEVLSRITGSAEYYQSAGGTIPTFVDAVYDSVLGRTADPSGRAYWINRLEGGTSVWAVARNLAGSQEYREIQVDGAYDRLLAVAPDAGARTYWVNRLKTARVESLLEALAGSDGYYNEPRPA